MTPEVRKRLEDIEKRMAIGQEAVDRECCYACAYGVDNEDEEEGTINVDMRWLVERIRWLECGSDPSRT